MTQEIEQARKELRTAKSGILNSNNKTDAPIAALNNISGLPVHTLIRATRCIKELLKVEKEMKAKLDSLSTLPAGAEKNEAILKILEEAKSKYEDLGRKLTTILLAGKVTSHKSKKVVPGIKKAARKVYAKTRGFFKRNDRLVEPDGLMRLKSPLLENEIEPTLNLNNQDLLSNETKPTATEESLNTNERNNINTMSAGELDLFMPKAPKASTPLKNPLRKKTKKKEKKI